mgnify:CR=1 FL=1
MNKYIKAAFCVPLAGIKYVILKLENGKRFHASFPAIMSPLTEVTVEGKSHLCIGKKLKMHNGAMAVLLLPTTILKSATM